MMKKIFTVFLIFLKNVLSPGSRCSRSALGDQTLERALTLGARFCHRAPNARALSITRARCFGVLFFLKIGGVFRVLFLNKISG